MEKAKWRDIRVAIKASTPIQILNWWRRWRLSDSKYADLSRTETFSKIYAERLWGDSTADFDSGEGSSVEVSREYCEFVRRFVEERRISKIVDLGCGDFRVGRQITSGLDLDYTGIDVVPDLIARNRNLFGDSGIRFECLDMVSTDLPPAQLCLIRQVFQHLSNAEIAQVLVNCQKYPYILVTEHVFSGQGLRPNLDKPHGPNVRIYQNSGVFLEKEPFNIPCKLVMQTSFPGDESIRSVLVENQVSTSQVRSSS